MVIVHGSDPALVRRLKDYLVRHGVEALDAPPDADLFSMCVEQRAHAVVCLAPDSATLEADTGELLRAASAPGSPQIVLVASTPSDGKVVRTIKHSGAPYVVLLVPPLAAWQASPDGVFARVASALRDDAPVGVVHELAVSPPRASLELARPRESLLARWLARVASAVRSRVRGLLALGQRQRSA